MKHLHDWNHLSMINEMRGIQYRKNAIRSKLFVIGFALWLNKNRSNNQYYLNLDKFILEDIRMQKRYAELIRGDFEFEDLIQPEYELSPICEFDLCLSHVTRTNNYNADGLTDDSYFFRLSVSNEMFWNPPIGSPVVKWRGSILKKYGQEFIQTHYNEELPYYYPENFFMELFLDMQKWMLGKFVSNITGSLKNKNWDNSAIQLEEAYYNKEFFKSAVKKLYDKDLFFPGFLDKLKKNYNHIFEEVKSLRRPDKQWKTDAAADMGDLGFDV